MPFAAPVQIPSARLTNASIANTIDDAVRAIDLLLATLFGVSQDTDITDFPLVRTSLLAAASGVATLDVNSKVLQRLAYEGSASGVAPLGADSKVPLANLPTGSGGGFDAASVRSLYPESTAGSTKLATTNVSAKVLQRLAYEAVASGVPTLNASAQVLQRLAYEDAAGGVPLLDGSGKLKWAQFPTQVTAAPFMTNGDQRATYANSRRLAAGTNIVLTEDAGAGTITLSSSGGSWQVANGAFSLAPSTITTLGGISVPSGEGGTWLVLGQMYALAAGGNAVGHLSVINNAGLSLMMSNWQSAHTDSLVVGASVLTLAFASVGHQLRLRIYNGGTDALAGGSWVCAAIRIGT